MKDSTMVLSIIRGSIIAIIIFVLNKLCIAAEWAFHIPQIIYIYYIALIVVIGFGIRSRAMKYYWVSLISFIVISIFIGIVAIIINIDNCIFKIIFGSDDEMWAGDGFMLLVVFMSTMIFSVIGMVVSLILTLIYQKRGKSK